MWRRTTFPVGGCAWAWTDIVPNLVTFIFLHSHQTSNSWKISNNAIHTNLWTWWLMKFDQSDGAQDSWCIHPHHFADQIQPHNCRWIGVGWLAMRIVQAWLTVKGANGKLWLVRVKVQVLLLQLSRLYVWATEATWRCNMMGSVILCTQRGWNKSMHSPSHTPVAVTTWLTVTSSLGMVTISTC